MTDKELLEKAAKAAGMVGYKYCESWKAIAQHDHGGFFGESWNPLTDDGDALRLAVKCGINPIQCIDSVDAMHFDSCIVETEMFEDHDGDVMAATRLAITRAAAAMVKE